MEEEKNEQDQGDTAEKNVTEKITPTTSAQHPYRTDPAGRFLDMSA